MHSRRIACLLLGLWVGAGLWMQWMAVQNAKAAETLLERPGPSAAAYFKTIDLAKASQLAHYLAAEQNRSLYEIWGDVQIAVSALFFFLLLFGTRMGKFSLALALLLFLIALGERLVMTPGMETVGRATDFAVNLSHRAHVATAVVSYGYQVAETSKWILAAAMAGLLIWQRSARSLNSRDEFNVVDKANYRHIDR